MENVVSRLLELLKPLEILRLGSPHTTPKEPRHASQARLVMCHCEMQIKRFERGPGHMGVLGR